jgi:hypothetical protein
MVRGKFNASASSSPFRAVLSGLSFVAAALALGLIAPSPAEASTTPVAREIYLLLDVSGSVNTTEFNLKKQGYVDAFNSPTIQGLIASQSGGVAVALGYFGSLTSSLPAARTVLSWQLLVSAADSASFANQINNTLSSGVRGVGGLTCISCGIDLAIQEIMNNAFTSSGPIIDISGDGQQSTNRTGGSTSGCDSPSSCLFVREARDAAALLGYQINGIPIGTGAGGLLLPYYDSEVRTANGFIVPAAAFSTFGDSLQQKLSAEIVDIPGPLPVMGFATAFVYSRRLRKSIKRASAVIKDPS